MTSNKNWLISKWTDLLVFFAPVWIIWVIFLSNQDYFNALNLPLWAWVVFILGIDVSHVWSSLFRTYLNKNEFKAHRKLLIITPFIVFFTSLILLYYSTGLFWRVMAYLAVFHFIKQQYGFVALFKLKNNDRFQSFISDKYLIYILTLYPIVYWHFNSESTFNWFVQNDFLPLGEWIGNEFIIAIVFSILNVLYWLLFGAWVLAQVRAKYKGEQISTGKILWVTTTAINWFFGIVYFNSDVVFSISNVVAHGVPYLALIYYYRVRKEEVDQNKRTNFIYRFRWVLTLIITVLIFALVEEYFWDMFVYRDHSAFFEVIYPYKWEKLSSSWALMIGISLLALPQQVHYVVDGFIWKFNAKNKYLKPIFKSQNES